MYELFLIIILLFIISEVFPALLSLFIFVCTFLYRKIGSCMCGKKMVVIYHIEDQSVWIHDIKVYEYSQSGIDEVRYVVDNHNGVYLSTCVFVLCTTEADELYNKLQNMPTEYDVYEYMHLNDNYIDIDEVELK